MTPTCFFAALLYFGGVPLLLTLLIRFASRLTDRLAPSVLDDTPLVGPWFIGTAGTLAAVWVLQCYVGIPIFRGNPCTCG